MKAILAALFLLAAAPAIATVSPEIPVSDPVYGPSPLGQYRVKAATDGSGYLAVWTESRGIVATRVSPAGEILDRGGIVIGGNSSSGDQRVVWNGTAYVILWTATSYSEPPHIDLARVSAEGEIVEAPRRLVENAMLGAVAANGSRVFAIYSVPKTQATDATDTRTLVLGSDARELAHGSLPSGGTRYVFDAAPMGSGFVAVWNENALPQVFIQAMRFDENGAPLGTQPQHIAVGYDPVVATDGTSVVILAREGVSGQLIWSSYLVTNNLSSISSPMALAPGIWLANPSITWSGDRYVVFTSSIAPSVSGTRPLLLHLDRSGRAFASATLTPVANLSTPGPISAVSRNGDVLLTWTESVWIEDRYSNVVVAGNVISAATLQPKSSPRYLLEPANHQQSPSAASGAGMTLVAWREPDGVFATRLRNQRSLDGRGVKLDSDGGGAPQVVFDGTQFVIGWVYGTSLKFRFISPNSGLLADVETLESLPLSFTLASGGGRTIVAWQNRDARIEASAIDAATRLIGPSTLVSPPGETSASPVAAWNGSEFLVAWDQYEVRSLIHFPNFDLFHLRVKGARLSPELALRDPLPLLLGDVEGARDEVGSIASNGNDWLVTWVSDGSIRARRVRHDGNLDATAEGTFIAKGFSPRVAWDGTRYAVAWAESERRTIFLAYLLSADPIVAGSPAAIVTTAQPPIVPFSLTSPSLLTIDVTYSRFAPEPAYRGVSRIFTRTSTGVTRIRAVR